MIYAIVTLTVVFAAVYGLVKLLGFVLEAFGLIRKIGK